MAWYIIQLISTQEFSAQILQIHVFIIKHLFAQLLSVRMWGGRACEQAEV